MSFGLLTEIGNSLIPSGMMGIISAGVYTSVDGFLGTQIGTSGSVGAVAGIVTMVAISVIWQAFEQLKMGSEPVRLGVGYLAGCYLGSAVATQLIEPMSWVQCLLQTVSGSVFFSFAAWKWPCDPLQSAAT